MGRECLCEVCLCCLGVSRTPLQRIVSLLDKLWENGDTFISFAEQRGGNSADSNSPELATKRLIDFIDPLAELRALGTTDLFLMECFSNSQYNLPEVIAIACVLKRSTKLAESVLEYRLLRKSGPIPIPTW